MSLLWFRGEWEEPMSNPNGIGAAMSDERKPVYYVVRHDSGRYAAIGGWSLNPEDAAPYLHPDRAMAQHGNIALRTMGEGKRIIPVYFGDPL